MSQVAHTVFKRIVQEQCRKLVALCRSLTQHIILIKGRLINKYYKIESLPNLSNLLIINFLKCSINLKYQLVLLFISFPFLLSWLTPWPCSDSRVCASELQCLRTSFRSEDIALCHRTSQQRVDNHPQRLLPFHLICHRLLLWLPSWLA